MDLNHPEKRVERTTHPVFIRNVECDASCHERWRCATVTREGTVAENRLRSLTGNYGISERFVRTGCPAATRPTMAHPNGKARVDSSCGCVDVQLAISYSAEVHGIRSQEDSRLDPR